MPNLVRLTVDEVLSIRRQMASTALALRETFGHIEPLDKAKLEMAVNRQLTSIGQQYKYDTAPELAATLFFGVAMDHAFENGNKRTALVSALVSLDKNKHLLMEATEDELYELARQLAAHELPLPHRQSATADSEIEYLAKWFKDRSRSRVLGDHPMMFSELRKLLGALGCTFSEPDGNYIKIKRDRWVYQTGYPKKNFQLDIPEVKRIRRALRLDEAHGVDSAGFYDLEGQVDRFVNEHRNLLKRLADL